MVIPFGLIALGAILAYSGLKNKSIIETLRGLPSSLVNTPYEADARAAAGKLASLSGGGSSKSKGNNSPSAYDNTQFASVSSSNTPSGVAVYDGKQVAAWIIPWLKKSRQAGWKGTVTSGYRTPAYSEHLCQQMCGAPSCPGRCAGRSSNHSGKRFPAGAVDVSDYENFARIQRRIHSPLKNDLPSDRVHFSVTGH